MFCVLLISLLFHHIRVVENASRYLHDEDPSSSRSIKSSLDQVLRKVKTKLEDIFNSPNVEQEKQSRLLKTPIEVLLPETWFKTDHNLQLPHIPREVELKIENLNRKWVDGDVIPDIDREAFFKPRKTRIKKRQRLKTRFIDRENESKSESKIYFTQIIKDRPKIDKMKKKKKETKFKKTKTRTSEPKGTNILDSYSPYIYAELLKENNTVDDLDTRETTTISSSTLSLVTVTEQIDVSEDTTQPLVKEEEEEEEILEEAVETVETVTLEVAVVDNREEKNSKPSDSFLPFIPPSGINFELDTYDLYDFTVIGEDAENDSDYEEVSPFSRQESSHVSVRNESWAVPVLVIGASFFRSHCLL